ncbi:MAG TPA: glycosyltransferase [Candidatus Acidoferrum sp.]|nr:glycosyltransferase [Candidatus Acidoferrum sp.]
MTILQPAHRKPNRRLLYLNSYGMAVAWRAASAGKEPTHHLWGCVELVRRGYEVAMPEEPRRDGRFFNYRRQDRRHLRFARSWLGPEGLVYSAHTVLFWIPFLAAINLLRCPIVTLFYGSGESLRLAGSYSAIIAMTPAAQSRATDVAPRARVAHLGWGVDTPFFPVLAYSPRWFLSCGKTLRDFETLRKAAALSRAPIRVINANDTGEAWPDTVELLRGDGQLGWQAVSYRDLVYEQYAGCAAALIILEPDPQQRVAAGFTQLLEAMALARPVIMTRTGAAPGEVDIEKEGCGIFVPPGDEVALAKALRMICEDPERAKAMGQAGRRLCETRYNIVRYADELDRVFQAL